jgi:excisionase family DNA binding protein
MDETLCTAAELAEYLKSQKRAIYELVRNGKIPCYRIGRQLRFDPAEVLVALKVDRLPLPPQDSAANQAQAS